MKIFSISILGAGLLLNGGIAWAQVIDCAGAALNNSEHAVCASAALHALDVSLAKRYAQVASHDDVQQSELEWISARNRCNGNVTCLTGTYDEHNAFLAALQRTHDRKIKESTPRAPLKHLFLRHAPAQLLYPITAQPPPVAIGANATNTLNLAAVPAPTVEQAPWNPLWLLIAVLCVSILLWQLLTNVCGKCPSCHHWFAKVEIDQKSLVGDLPASPVRRRHRLWKSTAKTSHAADASLRGRIAVVHHYNQCRMCLHEWETTSQETL